MSYTSFVCISRPWKHFLFNLQTFALQKFSFLCTCHEQQHAIRRLFQQNKYYFDFVEFRFIANLVSVNLLFLLVQNQQLNQKAKASKQP